MEHIIGFIVIYCLFGFIFAIGWVMMGKPDMEDSKDCAKIIFWPLTVTFYTLFVLVRFVKHLAIGLYRFVKEDFPDIIK